MVTCFIGAACEFTVVNIYIYILLVSRLMCVNLWLHFWPFVQKVTEGHITPCRGIRHKPDRCIRCIKLIAHPCIKPCPPRFVCNYEAEHNDPPEE